MARNSKVSSRREKDKVDMIGEVEKGKVLLFPDRNNLMGKEKSLRDKNKKYKKILIVDDEPYMLNLLKINLVDEGYEVIEALDGEDALKKVKQELPNLVLLDTVMPKKSGFDVCKALKEDPETNKIPVIMISAKGESERQKSVELGADVFISKPFSPLKLLAEIRRLI